MIAEIGDFAYDANSKSLETLRTMYPDPEILDLRYRQVLRFTELCDEFTTRLANASTYTRELYLDRLVKKWGEADADFFVSEVRRKVGEL